MLQSAGMHVYLLRDLYCKVRARMFSSLEDLCCKVRAFVKFMCVRLLVLQSASISYVSARVQLTFVGNWC